MKDVNPMVLFHALNMWDYNVDANDKFDAVYGVRPDDDYYKVEKLGAIAGRSLAAWSGELDFEHQQKLVQAALDKYGEEAVRWTASNEKYAAEREVE